MWQFLSGVQESLFSVLSIDKDTGNISPSILASIVEKVCFPTALYGAEIWHNMTRTDIETLEKKSHA